MFSKKARTTPAVASGRMVSESPLRSAKVYISLETMSVSSPMDRANNSVRSKMGVRISLKPKALNTSRAVASIKRHLGASGGSRSFMPLTAWMAKMPPPFIISIF